MVYELERGGGYMYIFHELTWYEKLGYILRCYKIRRFNPNDN